VWRTTGDPTLSQDPSVGGEIRGDEQWRRMINSMASTGAARTLLETSLRACMASPSPRPLWWAAVAGTGRPCATVRQPSA